MLRSACLQPAASEPLVNHLSSCFAPRLFGSTVAGMPRSLRVPTVAEAAGRLPAVKGEGQGLRSREPDARMFDIA